MSCKEESMHSKIPIFLKASFPNAANVQVVPKHMDMPLGPIVLTLQFWSVRLSEANCAFTPKAHKEENDPGSHSLCIGSQADKEGKEE